MSMSAFAQTSVTVTHPHFSRPSQKTIIKERLGYLRTTITCSNTSEAATFIYANDGMQASERTIEGIFVNDMVVEKDSVYFCGKHHPTGNGIVGYFKISELFSETGVAQIDTVLRAGEDGYRMDEMTRLVVFKDPMAMRHIISIGKTKEDGYPCIVDYVLGFNSPVYCGGYVNNRNEEFTDLKTVYNSQNEPYLVTVGYETSNGRYLNVRVHDLVFFTSSSVKDWQHLFCVDTGYVNEWLDGGVLLAATGTNSFATVSHRDYGYNGTGIIRVGHNLHLGFFNLDDIISHSVYGMTDNYEIPITLSASRTMNEFIYNTKKKHLVFLHTYTADLTGIVKNEYCEVDPALLSASGSLQAYTNPDNMFYGLSVFWIMGKYILSGYRSSNPETLKYQMNTFATTSHCAEPVIYKYNQKRVLSSRNTINAIKYKLNQADPIVFECIVEELPLYIECETE